MATTRQQFQVGGLYPADTASIHIPPECEPLTGWTKDEEFPSLREVNSSIAFPETGPWYKKLFAFAGLGFMISVGYMDPGNWATDLSAGATAGYKLLIAVLLSSFAAMYLQSLALKLGVVAERDLAQACRDAYPTWVNYVLWILMEIAIAATDLAEVIGSATALYLLFNIPLWAGVLITAADVLFILAFGTSNFRILEILVALLTAAIFSIFSYEMGIAKPDWVEVAKGLTPNYDILANPDLLYLAVGIVGATVMPHNLFLHSSIVQTRAYNRTHTGKRNAVRFGTIDSCVSLSVAFFINAAILILAASAFHYATDNFNVADITTAYNLLAPALGNNAAKYLFAVALLAAGQNATITGTLAGQVVMEGFLQIRLRPWLRRMLTRGIAIIPAALICGLMGTRGAGALLLFSQVVLSLTLSGAVIPLVHFTSSRAKMGSFVNGRYNTVCAVLLAIFIAGLNGFLIIDGIISQQFAQALAI